VGKHIGWYDTSRDLEYQFAFDRAQRRGRHSVQQGPCQAHVVVAGRKHYCQVFPSNHTKHSHALYGEWTGDVYDYDQFRKKLIY
jgi:hypothetical protein